MVFRTQPFPTSLIWLSTSEPRSVSDRLVCSLKLLPNSQYIIHAQNNGINRSYKDLFLRDSSFYWQTSQNKANMTSWKWAIFASRRPCYPALKRGWSYLLLTKRFSLTSLKLTELFKCSLRETANLMKTTFTYISTNRTISIVFYRKHKLLATPRIYTLILCTQLQPPAHTNTPTHSSLPNCCWLSTYIVKDLWALFVLISYTDSVR